LDTSTLHGKDKNSICVDTQIVEDVDLDLINNMKDHAKHDFLKDIEVEGKVGGFKGDWIVGLALVAIVILVIIFPHGIK